MGIVKAIYFLVRAFFVCRLSLAAENLALRQQVAVYRDGIYGEYFQKHVKSTGIEEVLIAPRSPWQNPYCE